MIKKGDFIEVDYVGTLKDTQDIFDITSAEEAKKRQIHDPRSSYGSKIICVGEHQIVRGIDDFLIGKECKTYTLTLEPEHAFGKKDAKLLKLIPTSAFQKKNIRPVPGLQLDIDGLLGTIRTVSGGRVIVDFNHPIAGRAVTYELHVKRIVTDDHEKLKGLLHILFGMPIPVQFDQGKATIDFAVPPGLRPILEEKVKKLIPSIAALQFKETKATVPP